MLGRNNNRGLYLAPGHVSTGIDIAMNLTRLAVPALLLLTLAASPGANASSYSDVVTQPYWQLAKKNELSLDQAAAKVRKKTGGRVLAARSQNRNGRTVHRIKVLMPSGHVKIVRVDAATGEIN